MSIQKVTATIDFMIRQQISLRNLLSQPIAGLYVMKDNFSVYKASRAFRFHSYYRGDN